MKTLSEIAKDIGVSRQAVYQKVNGMLSTNLHEFTQKINGILHIDKHGESIIKSAFNSKNKIVSVVNDDYKLDSKVIDNFTVIVDSLNTQIENSKEQIKIKDEQILKLQELLQHQQGLLENQQVLFKKEQEKNILLLERKKNKTFWQKWSR